MEKYGLLCAREIKKSYGSRIVMEVAELSLGTGAALCVFGPNGSGKSTLLDILALAVKPDGGKLIIGGADALFDPRAVRGIIGYAPQDIALFDELTVTENLLCWSRDSGAAAKTDVERVMAEMMLSELRKKRVRDLSGGMKRRVNLAVALLGTPALLVLDEPFAGMDFEAIENTLTLLETQKKKGVALILSDHSTSRPLPLMDKVLVLREGTAVYSGSREDFLSLGGGADEALRRILTGDRL